jgi:hypothetical protein
MLSRNLNAPLPLCVLAFLGHFGLLRPARLGATSPTPVHRRCGRWNWIEKYAVGGFARRPGTLLSFPGPYQCQGGLEDSLGGRGGNGWSQKVPRVSLSDAAAPGRGDCGMFIAARVGRRACIYERQEPPCARMDVQVKLIAVNPVCSSSTLSR